MILSVGTWGCNLQCRFCQNWEIAHGDPAFVATSPDKLAELAEQQGPLNIGVAYTYSEPIVWFEYVCDAAEAVKKRGLKNVLVTNGFINPEPLAELLPLMDAMNIDVKAFSPGFYQDICGGGLEAVKKTIATAASSCHVEVTTLVVPGLNDGDEEITQLARWLAGIDPANSLTFIAIFSPVPYGIAGDTDGEPASCAFVSTAIFAQCLYGKCRLSQQEGLQKNTMELYNDN
jgi:pyruvate formate lyase activating enzyme